MTDLPVWVALSGIYLIPVSGGEPRAITWPDAPGSDRSPAFSPDGRQLAYASCRDTHFNFAAAAELPQ